MIRTTTVGDARSEVGDCVLCSFYSTFLILSLLDSLFCALSNKHLTSHDGLNQYGLMSATIGESGRIDGSECVRPQEVLTMLSNVETCFEHMDI
ncbi:hypothetical protein T01_11888 [Trichinella spiralis]|uniref:Uncharacterized protein n=1 Tax=Trichinella spiralis TaxID=6334 RepID=A0A0V1B3V8_TRISP|nr:hypothetical protein T01_11888 [Trichinella spiralis]